MIRRVFVSPLAHPKGRALLVAGSLLAVTLAAVVALVRLSSDVALAPLLDRNTSTCTAGVTTTLKPISPRLCDPVSVTTTLQTVCPVCPEGLSVVFIQDDTPYPEWQKKVSLEALEEFVRYTQTGQKVSVGVIHYNGAGPRIVLRPTLNLGAARGPLTSFRVAHDPRAQFMEAAKAGVQMIRDSRRLHNNKVQRECEFVIYFVYTKIYYPDKGAEMIQAGRTILREVDNLYVGCPHQHPEECTIWEPQVPESERYYTEDPEAGKLRNMCRNGIREAQTAGAITIRTLAIDQWLPLHLRLVPDSFNVPPSQQMRDGNNLKLTWSWRTPKTDAITLTFRAEPELPGAVTSDVRSSWSDNENRRGELRVQSAPIEILNDDCTTPTPVPTPTPQPTPTERVLPSPTPTATATPVPTSTPTPRPRPIYLPVALREECNPTTKHADVVLVIDVSTSMNRLTRAGRTKLAATLDAARQFVSYMDLDPSGTADRVGVVGFNRDAWVETPLCADRARVIAAINALPARQQEYTRLDLAFERGGQVLNEGRRRDGSSAVLILLTDGLPNQVPVAEDGRMETTVIRQAMEVKKTGITVYTIGLGAPNDIDPVLLQTCATTPDHYYYSPDAEGLAAIYGAIAYRIGCPPESFWGRR